MMNSEGGVIALGVLGNVLSFFGGDTNKESSARLLVGRVTPLFSKFAMIASGEARSFEGRPPIDAFLNRLFSAFAAAFRAPTRSLLSLSRPQLDSRTSPSLKHRYTLHNARPWRSRSPLFFCYSPCEHNVWGCWSWMVTGKDRKSVV